MDYTKHDFKDGDVLFAWQLNDIEDGIIALGQVSGGNVDQEQIEQAVSDYLAQNPVSGGMTKTEKNLILQLFRNAAYTSAGMNPAFTQLETLWSGSGDDSGGDVHSHSYTSSITTAATCTTAGVETYTCSCGHSYTEPIPATGHNYVDGVCTVCGAADPTYTPGVTLTSITATYNGGEVPIGTAVSDLKSIAVTAHYSNGTSATVVGYTLSGTIAEGNNTITVTYEGKTATFVVVGANVLTSISAIYSGGSVTVGTAVSELTGIVVTAHYSDGTSEPVTAYTMTGTIAEGSNTITVSYGGKTTTFTVVGVAVATETEVLNTFKWRGSGWPTGTDNGDGSWTFDATGGQTVYDEIPGSTAFAYWSMIYPGNIAGGQLAIKFNKPVTSGYVEVCVYAVSKDLTLAYKATNNQKQWVDDVVGGAGAFRSSGNFEIDIPAGLYPFILVRKGTLLMEGDAEYTNITVANHIANGDITFEVTG